MKEESKSDKKTMFGNQFADSEVLVQVNKWVLNSLARHVACDDIDLHDVLGRDLTSLSPKITGALGAIRLDVLQAAALMEVLYSVKHVLFSTESYLMEMMHSGPFTFDSCYSNTIRPRVQPTMLAISIVSGMHVQICS